MRIIILTTCSVFLTLFVVFGALAKPVNQLREDIALDFATVIPDPAGDTVTISPSGSISANGFTFFMGTPSAAQFSARGDKNAVVAITFSTGDILTGPGTSMPLGSFTHDAGGTPTTGGDGRISFNVGASLTVNPSQAEGAYSGTYVITVDYP